MQVLNAGKIEGLVYIHERKSVRGFTKIKIK